MEKQPALTNTKRETRECYNYRVKEHLTRNYRKSKTGPGPQRK